MTRPLHQLAAEQPVTAPIPIPTSAKMKALLFPGAGIGAQLFGPDLSAFLNEYYRQHNVEVLPGETAVVERHLRHARYKLVAAERLSHLG